VPKVSNLSARGTLRLGLTRLVPQLPGFGALLVSLAREPQVTTRKRGLLFHTMWKASCQGFTHSRSAVYVVYMLTQYSWQVAWLWSTAGQPGERATGNRLQAWLAASCLAGCG
jgi:hypothetical protein